MDAGYSPTELTKLLHSMPHLSFKLVLLPSPSFTLDEPTYLESLAVISLMPVIVFLLSMIGLFVYYCCIRVKRPAPNKADSSACYCSVCLMIIFVMLALGGISVTVYGNIQVHEGIESASSHTATINQSFSLITNKVYDSKLLLSSLQEETVKLTKVMTNHTYVWNLLKNVESLNAFGSDLPDQNMGGNDRLEWLIEIFEVMENHRTIITFSLIGSHALVCFLALLGICFRSRWLLILVTVVGVICLLVSYLYIGCMLMFNTALADLCMDPYAYIEDQAVTKLYMDNKTAQYYLYCTHDQHANDPFMDVIGRTETYISQIRNGILDVGNLDGRSALVEVVLDNMYRYVNDLDTILQSLSNHLNCYSVHMALEECIPALCVSVLNGVFIVGIAVLCICFTLTAVLCAAPKTWRRFSRPLNNNRDEMSDLDDVFLPGPTNRPTVSRTNNLLFTSSEDRFSGRISSGTSAVPVENTNTLSFFRRSEEDVTLLEPPPPEYSPPRPGSRY